MNELERVPGATGGMAAPRFWSLSTVLTVTVTALAVVSWVGGLASSTPATFGFFFYGFTGFALLQAFVGVITIVDGALVARAATRAGVPASGAMGRVFVGIIAAVTVPTVEAAAYFVLALVKNSKGPA